MEKADRGLIVQNGKALEESAFKSGSGFQLVHAGEEMDGDILKRLGDYGVKVVSGKLVLPVKESKAAKE